MPISIRAAALLLLVFCSHSAFSFPTPQWMGIPRNYVCERAVSTPVIDGQLNDPAWKNVTWTEKFTDIEGDLQPAPTLATTCAMLWDDEFFYIAARLEEPHTSAFLTRRDAVIYHDNDFEVFIDPDGDNHLYYELEINALNTVWDLLLVRPYRDGAPAVNSWDIQGLRTAVHIDGTLNNPTDRDRGWSVELAIPWKVLAECAGRPSPPAEGDIWRVNFSRVQWQYEVADGGYRKKVNPNTGRQYPENNWVWSPQGLVAMHYPENWGEVLFAGPQYDGNSSYAFASSTENVSIAVGQSLMDVYYAQKQFHEDHGQFAATEAELQRNWGLLMKRIRTEIETTDGPALILPYKWKFSLDATADRFTATIDTPAGVMTVDETGRLIRTPLQPPEDCNCLHPKP